MPMLERDQLKQGLPGVHYYDFHFDIVRGYEVVRDDQRGPGYSRAFGAPQLWWGWVIKETRTPSQRAG